ncbi:hypothetical protein [Lacrimispora indolis]|uniref:hypothetical protein n=1 Tax=Lacrimispora indolis TaxID=69825 RepID=UPI000462D73D|nr:hypothetical protein [[Clostridium] methoxybenzovorans]
MEQLKNVRGTQPQRPPELEILDTMVYTRTNIKRIEEEGSEEMSGFVGWEYDEFIYEKNEFIKDLSIQNQELGTGITNAQIALTELFEQLIGG